MRGNLFTRSILIVVAAFFLLLFSPARARSPLGQIADSPWPMYQHDPQHTGRSPILGATHRPELLWSVPLPAGCIGENGGIAITAEGNLLLAMGGCLHQFDPVTRQFQWTYEHGSIGIQHYR